VLSQWMFLILVGFGTAGDVSSVRQQEALLAHALRTADKSTLLRLTDAQLHVVLQCSSAVKAFSTDMSREDWIDIVAQARTATYNARVGEIRLVPRRNTQTHQEEDFSTASIVETISLSTRDGAVEKHLFAWDMWVKRDETWKLANRTYRQVCDQGPHLSFP
jgi:hypothetical protein